ncbi:MAG: DsbA family protein [Demequina sp.]|jgi:protein-disulfide isomerase|nr:DsbA family protein [Demequina sp.]
MANKKQDPTDARAAAKAKAQQAVKAKERRTTVIIIAVSLVVIAAFAGIVYFIVNSSKVPALSDAHAPAVADETGGIPVGTGGVAGVDVPTDVTRVDLYIDLMCPVCNQFEQINGADLNTLREDGTIALYYHPISILDRASSGTKYSTRAASAVAVVADQDPAHFLDFVGALYNNQPQENTTGLSDDEIAAIAIGVGVPADIASELKNGEFEKWVTAATDQASQDGMSGTPTVMVNREILDPNQVNYFTPGTLKAYLEQLAAG